MQRIFYTQVILLVSFFSVAQESAVTSSKNTKTPDVVYYKTLGEQSPLYNGREYVDYGATIHLGHPFLNTTEFTRAVIHFDGMVFEDAMILFDIIKEKLIILHFNHVFKIDFPLEKVTEVKMLNNHLIHLYPDSAGVIAEGFYDHIYQGRISVLAKRRKLIREERTGTEILRVVDQKDIFYLKQNGRYQVIKGMRSLRNLLNMRREPVRQQLKKNGIKFRKDREAAILLAVRYYDQLSN